MGLFENLKKSRMLRKQKKTKSRFISVVWHDKPVFISGLTEKQIKDELGFQVFTAEYLKLRDEFGWHHSANEYRGKGVQGLQAGIRAKKSGQAVGFPDWICVPRKLSIELKLPNGDVSKEQLEWLALFKNIGFHAEVVRSFERFVQIVESA